MTIKKFDYFLENYFPSGIQYLSYGVLVSALILLIMKYFLAGSILLIGSFIVLAAKNRFEIDLNTKSYREYIFLVGFKFGEWEKFETLEYLFINKSKVSQTMNYKSLSSTVKSVEYNGYLKFSSGEKIHLITKSDKDKLLKELTKIGNDLSIDVIDYTPNS